MDDNIILAILDSETMYSEKLTDYINQCKDTKIHALAFTSASSLKQYLEKNKVTVLLCEKELYFEFEKYAKAICLILTTKLEEGTKYIFKYQSAVELIKRLSSALHAERGLEYHASGNCFALCSALTDYRLRRLCKKVAEEKAREGKAIFIDMFPFSYEKTIGGCTLSELVYYLKSGKGEKNFEKVEDGEKEYEIIAGVDYWKDIREISEEDISRLIDYLLNEMHYESVIISVDLLMPSAEAILKVCKSIFCPEPETVYEQECLEELKRQMIFSGNAELFDKIVLCRIEESREVLWT